MLGRQISEDEKLIALGMATILSMGVLVTCGSKDTTTDKNVESSATPQPSISQINGYWTPVQALGEGIINGEVTADNLQEKLDAVVTAITAPLGE